MIVSDIVMRNEVYGYERYCFWYVMNESVIMIWVVLVCGIFVCWWFLGGVLVVFWGVYVYVVLCVCGVSC